MIPQYVVPVPTQRRRAIESPYANVVAKVGPVLTQRRRATELPFTNIVTPHFLDDFEKMNTKLHLANVFLGLQLPHAHLGLTAS